MIATVLRWQILPRASRGFGLRLASPALARCYASSSFPPHTVIKMPALSPTMTAGNIGTWQKKPGDTIAPGDVLVEIETDKAQMDFEFQDDGVIAKLLKESGEKDVPVGNPIAVLVQEGTDISAFSNFSLDDAGGEPAAPAPKKKDSESSSDGGEKSDSSKTTTPAPEPEPESTTPPSGAPQSSLAREPNMSFRTKDLAIKLGVNIGSLKGSGSGGRITDEDVKKASASGSGGAGAGAAGARYEDTPLTNMRKTIASRLLESTKNNPHYFVTSTLSVTRLLKLRSSLNQSADGRYKLSVNDFIMKAVAVASRRVPAVNASWRDDTIRQFNTVDISVAVATPSGLITPIVTGCEARGLASISSRVKELALKARDGALKPEEYQGGTISISNMGMNAAVDHFTAIINPPQAAILAVGTTKKTAIPGEDGQVVWDDQISVTASFDHKVIDGAVGAEWMLELKKVVENPLELLL